MTDITKQITAIELLLETTDADDPTRPGLEARLAKLRAQLSAATSEANAAPLAPQTAQSGGVNLGSAQVEQIDKIVGQDDVAGDKVNVKNVYFGSAPDEDDTALLATYLAGVIGTASHLTLTEVDNADLEQNEVLLEDVYTRLEVASAAGRADARGEQRPDAPTTPEETRQLTAIAALVARGRMVLLGAPGSGKSTLTRFLSLCLARTAQGDARWLARLGVGWTPGALLPIRVELGDFAAWLARGDAGQGAELLLWDYLAARYPSLPALIPLLRARAQAGQALLLLDGLDEVGAGADGQPLRRVRATIYALAADARLRHILVTCRVLDYEEKRRQLPDSDWPVERLIPFAPELQREFIDRWYATLKRLQRPLIGDADDLRRLLREAIGKRPDLRRLAGNPLLLTMMALLHASKGRLPEKRAELYAECLDLLLRRWRRGPGRPALEERLGLPGWDTGDTDRLLNHLGFVAHSQESAGAAAEDETTSGATLAQDLLINTAAGVFKLYRDPDPYARAEQFCSYVGQYSNGVLQQHGPDSYRFPHRTFQEFLAARRLVDDRDWQGDERDVVDRLRARVGSAQWREVLLLAVSLLIIQGQARRVAALVRALLGARRTGTRAWAEYAVVAGEILTQAERKHFDGVGEDRLWDAAVAALRRAMAPVAEPSLLTRLMRQPSKPLLEVADRVRAGMALSLLGDPRLGVGSLEPQWCVAPAGEFLLGSNDTSEEAKYDGKPQRTVDLPGFRIARYPVTNAQWRAFLEAGGYHERRWWSDAGWAVKERKDWSQPAYWDDPRFNGSNQPVVGVSWYEAIAFCSWLSVELGYDVRLPNEAEWEKAARGSDGWIYPWGNNWDAAKANTDEAGFGTTTPVGCFPDGASPCGALDMSGNVWEWTATPWTGNYEQSDGTARETEDGERFVVRGGAWDLTRWFARCAYRSDYSPAARDDYLGVRVVAALTHDG